jgi:hypothetical protein
MAPLDNDRQEDRREDGRDRDRPLGLILEWKIMMNEFIRIIPCLSINFLFLITNGNVTLNVQHWVEFMFSSRCRKKQSNVIPGAEVAQ